MAYVKFDVKDEDDDVYINTNNICCVRKITEQDSWFEKQRIATEIDFVGGKKFVIYDTIDNVLEKINRGE